MKLPVVASLCAAAALSAQVPGPQDSLPAPIYRVNVISRSVVALNYGHRTIPTKVGMNGTLLLPGAHGDALIQARRGSVEVVANLKDLPPPSRFGPQYLTYVMWALTPEGRATNLGEVVTNRKNDAKLRTATELQSFALIVTAEPYYAVTQPSGVVVMENIIRPDTIGTSEYVNARYELLPPREYTYQVGRPEPETPLVSMKEYESLLALYQALNAIQIAQAQGVDRVAPEAFHRARMMYLEAHQLHQQKGDAKRVVMLARESAQIMEDARLIATKRQQP
jgi:hypothetical protein